MCKEERGERRETDEERERYKEKGERGAEGERGRREREGGRDWGRKPPLCSSAEWVVFHWARCNVCEEVRPLVE